MRGLLALLLLFWRLPVAALCLFGAWVCGRNGDTLNACVMVGFAVMIAMEGR